MKKIIKLLLPTGILFTALLCASCATDGNKYSSTSQYGSARSNVKPSQTALPRPQHDIFNLNWGVGSAFVKKNCDFGAHKHSLISSSRGDDWYDVCLGKKLCDFHFLYNDRGELYNVTMTTRFKKNDFEQAVKFFYGIVDALNQKYARTLAMDNYYDFMDGVYSSQFEYFILGKIKMFYKFETATTRITLTMIPFEFKNPDVPEIHALIGLTYGAKHIPACYEQNRPLRSPPAPEMRGL